MMAEAGSDRLAAALEALAELYRWIDERAAQLARAYAGRLQCRRGCRDCCQDGLTVFGIEAAWIRRRHGPLLAAAAAHRPGACAFLDPQGACRIYPDRPYVCRTQGLPLRWIEQDAAGRPVELRDICPCNAPHLPVETLPAEGCWTLGPAEEALARLQAHGLPDGPLRVALRDLFGAAPQPPAR